MNAALLLFVGCVFFQRGESGVRQILCWGGKVSTHRQTLNAETEKVGSLITSIKNCKRKQSKENRGSEMKETFLFLGKIMPSNDMIFRERRK